MSINLNFTLSSTSANFFVSSLAIELYNLADYIGTYWHAEATAQNQTTIVPTSKTTTLTCPEDLVNFFGDISGTPIPLIISISDLSNADHFIVVKTCLFTKSVTVPTQTISNLDSSNGTATSGIVKTTGGIPGYTSSTGEMPATGGTFKMFDSWKDTTPSTSGVMSWFFPVNTSALVSSTSVVTLTLNATVIS